MITRSSSNTTTRVHVRGTVALDDDGCEILAARRTDTDSDTLVARHPRHPSVEVVLDTVPREGDQGLRGEPTEGWRINYRSLPRDASELAAEVDRMERLIAAGLLDRVSAYQQLHPGLTDQEAEAAVQRIAETNAGLSGAAPRASVPTSTSQSSGA